jgi:tripartite-type tricarboxylate transporter receptor subunit TctC
LQDLVSGQIDMQIEPASNFYAQLKSGNIKAYAMTSPARIGAAPDVPTTAEAGLPSFRASLWYGLWAPKNTPKDIVAKLNATMLDVFGDAAVKKLDAPSRELQAPEALRAFQKSEAGKWWPIIKAANIVAK